MQWFKDFLKENMASILPSLMAIISAFCTLAIVWIKTRKSKLELQNSNIELQKQKLELERQMYEGSYIICPDCKRKILLKDMKFIVDKKE